MQNIDNLHVFFETNNDRSYRDFKKLSELIKENQKTLNNMNAESFWNLILIVKKKNYSLIPFKETLIDCLDKNKHLICQNNEVFKWNFLEIFNQLAIEDTHCFKNESVNKIFHQFLNFNEKQTIYFFDDIISTFGQDFNLNSQILKSIAQFYGIDKKTQSNNDFWHIAAFYNAFEFATWLKDKNLSYIPNDANSYPLDKALFDSNFSFRSKKKIVSLFYELEKNTLVNWQNVNVHRIDKIIEYKNNDAIEFFVNQKHDFTYPYDDYYLDKMITLKNEAKYDFEEKLYNSIISQILEKQKKQLENALLNQAEKKEHKIKI